jgi:hypothetical protein
MTKDMDDDKLCGTQPVHLVVLLVVGASVTLSLSITRQSLWIDEAVMAYFAAYSDLKSMVATVTQLRTSDPQMPLYIMYLWGWAQLFGTSEYALRAANIPFAMVLVGASAWTSWRVLGRPVLWVVFSVSPFVWFYMNEARPYIAIMAFSAVSTGYLMAYFIAPGRYAKIAPWLCLSALWIACGLQMLSVFLAPSLIALAMFAMKDKRLAWSTVRRDWALAFLIHMPLFFALGAYFTWTLAAGAGGMRETPGWGNVIFALYEYLGFMGLGPPRHILRVEQSLTAFLAYWPWVAIGTLTTIAFLSLALFQILSQRQGSLRSLVLALLSGIGLFIIASAIADFRFLGRHLAAFYPLFSFVLIAAIGELASRPAWRRVARVVVLSLLCTWLISDARLWALPEYQKDDYRSAAETALKVARRSDAIILWAADGMAGRYYGIEFDGRLQEVKWLGRGRGVLAANWSQTEIMHYLNSVNDPVLLVLGKTDLYDAAEAWTATVRTLTPFEIASPNTFKIYLFSNGRLELSRSSHAQKH